MNEIHTQWLTILTFTLSFLQALIAYMRMHMAYEVLHIDGNTAHIESNIYGRATQWTSVPYKYKESPYSYYEWTSHSSYHPAILLQCDDHIGRGQCDQYAWQTLLWLNSIKVAWQKLLAPLCHALLCHLFARQSLCYAAYVRHKSTSAHLHALD